MDKKNIEIILTIFIVFLGSLLIFSVVNGKVTVFMIIGALSVTYIFVHYWERQFLKKKYKDEIKQEKNM
ncbi:MAG: hypothetical protein CR972_04545 [Candidatus Moraniibacteriota bacterium]|nr:MAG: hypothetical protein CR972_04545 [Candidatus Moranbacteria bacterium]